MPSSAWKKKLDDRCLPADAARLAVCRAGFSPPLARRPRRLRGSLARDARRRGLRLPAHRLSFYRAEADDAANAADDVVRRCRRCHGRAPRTAHHADHRRHFDAAELGDPGAPRLFFYNDTPTTEIYTLSLHDALPIYRPGAVRWKRFSMNRITEVWSNTSEQTKPPRDQGETMSIGTRTPRP